MTRLTTIWATRSATVERRDFVTRRKQMCHFVAGEIGFAFEGSRKSLILGRHRQQFRHSSANFVGPDLLNFPSVHQIALSDRKHGPARDRVYRCDSFTHQYSPIHDHDVPRGTRDGDAHRSKGSFHQSPRNSPPTSRRRNRCDSRSK
jgi:hypothetical protein